MMTRPLSPRRAPLTWLLQFTIHQPPAKRTDGRFPSFGWWQGHFPPQSALDVAATVLVRSLARSSHSSHPPPVKRLCRRNDTTCYLVVSSRALLSSCLGYPFDSQ
jgi:hypothetical protein